MVKYNCLNPIAKEGLDLLGDNFAATEDVNNAEVVLV